MITSWNIKSLKTRKPVIYNSWNMNLPRQKSQTQEEENTDVEAHFPTHKKNLKKSSSAVVVVITSLYCLS